MKVLHQITILLVVFALAACGARSDGTEPGEDLTGGEDAVDMTGEDSFEDLARWPETIEDTLEDTLEDSLEDSLEDTLEDSLEDTLEDVIEPPPPPELVITECGDLPAPVEGACSIQEGSAVIVLRGVVLAPWEVFKGGEVVISSGGDIACVGCDCSGQSEYAGATVITCPDGIVSPGLINAHDHITYNGNYPGDWGTERFDHRHDWRCGIRGHTEQDYDQDNLQTQVIWAELRHVLGGATSIAGSGSAPGFLRNLDRDNWMEGLDIDGMKYNTFPLGDWDCTLKSEGCDYPSIDGVWVLENTCYIPHVAEGIDKETRNEFLCLSSEDNGGVDLTEFNSAFIHAVGLKAVDVAEMAVNGTALVWSPRTNISLYGHTAQVTMFDTLGARIGIGSDWTLSGSINMLRELNCAAYLNDNHFDSYFTDHELWLMATTWNAEALHMETAMGSLAQGLAGDVAIFQGDGTEDWFRYIFDANPSQIHLVLRGGIPLYGDIDLVGAVSGGGVGCEELPAPECLAGKAVCIEAETGETYVSLLPTNAMNYPLAYCGVPEGEVTCVPFREGEFDGTITEDDVDGDGVPNEQDNCPAIFNPGRPLDNGLQADHDQDGEGDVCDVCPLQPFTDECEPPDPNDKDADTVPNAEDNCPVDFNPDQEDMDNDGKGDVCDLCPEFANPGDGPCPATIYDIKTGAMPLGAKVSLGGVVTAVASPRFWIQVPEDELEYGYKFSGVYAYVPSSNPGNITIPAAGDRVEFTADVKDWMGQIQLDWVEDLVIVESDVALPTPVDVTPEQVATGGEDAAAYEGVLVTVTQQPVTELIPDYGEFVLAGSLIVDDAIWLMEPFPVIDDILTVTGPLMWTYNNSKLEPRGPQDVIEELGLATFGPSPVFLLADGVSTPAPPLVATLTVPAPDEGLEVVFESSNVDIFPDTLLSFDAASDNTEINLQTAFELATTETVTVSLSYGGKTLSADVTVINPAYAPAPVAFDPAAVTAVIDEGIDVLVYLDVPALAGEVEVFLEILGEGDPIATVPAGVIVPMGAQSANFAVTGGEAGVAQLRAWNDSGEVITDLEVMDIPAVGLILTEVLYDVPSGDSGYEWVEIFNGTTDTIDLSGYSLANGGTSYTSAVWQLEGTLVPGQCVLIGGPLSEEANGFPVYDLELDFDPDIQNSGAKADGVALFAVPAAQVTDVTVPVDAVIYGSSNDNNLWDETGAAGDVDVGDASAGSSISRVGEGWEVTPDPTPNDCSHAL